MTTQNISFEELANKCMTQIKNALYFQYKPLSPAIYRMKIEWLQPGAGLFGTDSYRIYADPMNVIMRYKKSSDELMRTYLHMIFHCVYLHPFVTKYNVDTGIWNIALDICCEAAVMRLDNPKQIPGDSERQKIINDIKSNIKMFLPELVYKELTTGKYNMEQLVVLFHMDDHVWLMNNQNNGNNNQNNNDGDDEDDDKQNPNQQNQQQNQQGEGNDGDGDGNENDKDNQGDGNNDSDNNGSSSGNGNENNQSQNNHGNSNSKNGRGNKNNNQNGNRGNQSSQNSGQKPSPRQQDKKQEWSDVARQVSTDMQSFHNQGSGTGDMCQEIDYLTQDKMEYDEFLRQFSVIEERMKVNLDEFDYMYYMYGMNGLQTPDGKKTLDKKVLLIEPLEYKEEKVIKDFVIAIDTSGSCSGELVKKFLNKTYSILKDTESFSTRVNIHIIQCDAAVHHDTKITDMNEMEAFMKNMKLYGFGGTDFRPVFEYVDTLIAQKEFDNLCGLIYFTDGYGTYPKMPTPYKTAFAFLEDYNNRDEVPAWAMSVYWNEDEA